MQKTSDLLRLTRKQRKARGYRNLYDHGYTVAKIAYNEGITEAKVIELIELCSTEEAQALS